MNNKNSFSLNDTLVIKGVAIIFMIFHHLFRLKEFTNGYSVNFFPLTIGRTAQIATFMKICVPMFVFLSGYGLLASYKKTKNKKNFFMYRVFKLMSTFWFICIASYIILQLYNKEFVKYYFSDNIYYGFTNIIFDIFGINGLLGKPCFSAHWWYIGASFIFIFLLPIFYNSAKKTGWLNTGIAIILIPRILNITSPSTTTALPYIFAFYLGMLANEKDLFKKIKNLKINSIIKFFIYLIIILVLYLIHTHYPRNILWELHFGIIPLIIILFIYEYISIIPIISNILKELGKQSYIMFLTHGFIITYFPNFIYSFKHIIPITLIVIIISYIISVTLNYIMKITKYNLLISNIEKKCFEK